ncbi:hypothetical protein [Polaribacter glomeratus]|uniref:Uncharacterized protein n=1 Tax=Polaribacter glomeratus TaxID=102 RepID=A0A2S7WGW8_9FLAO|nr:hypothetical protein [Polaribacter glomeratus]PQJ76860.1 hypothetical protein BTO16_13395 [Polaribacter glomeratus]TXD67297.1 hypothetical protein ESX12_01520 [Polaribacter glomeratus]
MKTLKILAILITTTLLSQCGSTKFEENPPFAITSAIYNNWTGGVPGNKGITVNISYTALYPIKFDSIFFLEKTAILESSKTKDKKFIAANFMTSKKTSVTLAKNASEEINNTVTAIKKFPYELKQNEAIISYIVKGKTKYFKVKSIKKGKSIFYPSTRKDNDIK